MGTFRNIYACLVHERPDCVIDLVRNLRCLDPASAILLYDGGAGREILGHDYPFERLGVVRHPSPRPLTWGRLHDFALDCMRYGLDHLGFDALTVVDSDQLATRPGYAAHLAGFLAARPGVGVVGNAPRPQPADTAIDPALAAHRERELWLPFLRRFPGGEAKFAHWSFWPGTVFTAAAAADLTRAFAADAQLRMIVDRTAIIATEEVLLPTVAALLGHEVAAHPTSHDYVRFRAQYTPRQIDAALDRPDVFWVHPIARRLDDPLRERIRARHGHYERPFGPGGATSHVPGHDPGLAPTLPILEAMRRVEGWLEDDEGDLLVAATVRALTEGPGPHAVVEVGSFRGRSTVVLGRVVREVDPASRVFAIDPHDGQVGAQGGGVVATAPTWEAFRRNVADAGVAGVIEPIRARSFEVAWRRPIHLFLVDGLHDYANVARDFAHFDPWVVPGGYAAFHDYADYYPGVRSAVDEILASGRYVEIGRARSMIVLRKRAWPESPPK